ncbi:hypothetical protein ElyMa_004060100 [Elysia marginata]|uniref:Uncharacterized protein n=1 Tax=Elysia marginata TaxID=1093978 RepID=A0AAV4G7U3_9GAST|nr:hypothetical protein ElyMa_004060100 [Elysia marginata]
MLEKRDVRLNGNTPIAPLKIGCKRAWLRCASTGVACMMSTPTPTTKCSPPPAALGDVATNTARPAAPPREYWRSRGSFHTTTTGG